MLHDIILALYGVGGDVLNNLCGSKYNPKDDAYTQTLLLHHCEETIVEQLKNIADEYRSINEFTKLIPQFGEEQVVLDDGTKLSPGMYLRAFTAGLFDALQPYRETLVNLEMEVLRNPEFTLDGILADVRCFVPVISTLNSIIKQIVVRQLHGCKILQVIHDNLSTGNSKVDVAIEEIMQHCHVVLMRQLTTWCLQGHLIDPYEEFFIRAQEVQLENLHSSMTTLDTESLAETATNDACILEYKVVEEFVPSYIPPSIPAKARFIGSTMALFQSDPRDKSTGTSNAKWTLTKPSFFETEFRELEPALMAEFQALQSSKIDISLLESIVDATSKVVTKVMFSLALGEANLLRELNFIKELFLLGRGELFVTFLRKANHTLLKPIGSTTGKDLSNLLYSSARNVQMNAEDITNKFTFRVPHKDSVPPGTTALSVMTLEYKPPWPLHLHLFTPAVLTSYNTLFHFLLQVKMAELNLHQVWIQNVKRKDRSLSESVCRLHNWLMFLIHNLQSYLQLDVLESEFTTFQNTLTESENFEHVIHVHSVFLTHIMSQAFLLTKEEHNPNQPLSIKRHPVNKVLMKLLELCDAFCAEQSRAELRDEVMDALSEALERNVFMLMNLVTVLDKKTPGLNLLILRLDFNKFFSNELALPTTN